MILIKHNDAGNLNPSFYWALEQFLLDAFNDDESPIYFFTWKVHGVISGKNQILENEVNFDYVKTHHIPFYRRPSGGGTVYADQNNLMFTIVKKKTADMSFKQELKKIVEVLNDLGIPATFSGRNDIVIDDKKISGNSFLVGKKGMIIHGTLLFDTDLNTMIRAITPSSEKLISKGIESVRSRVTNIKHYTYLTLDEFRDRLEEKLTHQSRILNALEIDTLKTNALKFLTSDWIYHEQPLHTKKVSKKFDFGEVTCYLDISYKSIKAVRIKGDFFELDSINELEEKLIGLKLEKETIEAFFKTLNVSKYIMHATNYDFVELLNKAVLHE